jgi:hypothetical protein
MRLSLRFILPLTLVLAALAYAVIPLVDTLTVKWFVRDLEIRSRLIASTIEGPLVDLLTTDSKTKLTNYFHRLRDRVLRPGQQAAVQDADLPGFHPL